MSNNPKHANPACFFYTTTMNNTECTKCPVATGTHKPAEALHQQIAEPQTQQPEALRQAEWLRKWFGCDGEMAAALLERQHARIAELEKYESNLIAQRDHCEEVIDRMADAVLGKDRPEWSSAYDFMDAAQEVDDRIAELEAQLEAIGAGGVEPLRKPAAQGVEAKDAARYRFLRDGDWRENDDVAPFVHLQLNALWDEKIDAALAAQAKQGENP